MIKDVLAENKSLVAIGNLTVMTRNRLCTL